MWLFIAPDSLLLIALTVGVAALWFGKVGLSKWILTIVAMVMLIIAFLPVGEWLLYPLESKYPHRPKLPQQVDGIIVLSGAENTRVSKSWGSVSSMLQRSVIQPFLSWLAGTPRQSWFSAVARVVW